MDSELLRRGMADSLAQAEALIEATKIQVNGSFATTAAQMVLASDSIELLAVKNGYVSRGGDKLAHALSAFSVDPAHLNCLDVGASTGGFSDCLLQNGAAAVTTIDVGYGILHERIADDGRVTVFERLNIRDAVPVFGGKEFQLLVADLSFISLRLVLEHLVALCIQGASLILLVKPQFEASHEEASRSRGVIRDPQIWKRTLQEVAEEATRLGAPVQGMAASPLVGAKGNREFFFHLIKGADKQLIDIDFELESMKLDLQ